MRPTWLISILFACSIASLGACRPLITINPETGRDPSDAGRPLCERVVARMIRCSTDADFRDRLRREWTRAVKSCEKAGKKDAERCDASQTCESFTRCLRR